MTNQKTRSPNRIIGYKPIYAAGRPVTVGAVIQRGIRLDEKTDQKLSAIMQSLNCNCSEAVRRIISSEFDRLPRNCRQ
jgi:hypothetical protein